MLPNLILKNATNLADSQKYPPHSTRRSQSGVVRRWRSLSLHLTSSLSTSISSWCLFREMWKKYEMDEPLRTFSVDPLVHLSASVIKFVCYNDLWMSLLAWCKSFQVNSPIIFELQPVFVAEICRLCSSPLIFEIALSKPTLFRFAAFIWFAIPVTRPTSHSHVPSHFYLGISGWRLSMGYLGI